jgi:hypothetical protein
MPPDNAQYLYGAYAVALAVYGLYSLSLWRGRRRVRERLRQLERGESK